MDHLKNKWKKTDASGKEVPILRANVHINSHRLVSVLEHVKH